MADDNERFQLNSRGWEPAYLTLYRSGELARRVEQAVVELAACRVCRRDCGVNRLAGEYGVCKTGRHAVVASYGAHFGEEDCLRGWNGSDTLFFALCNLRCVFCQNYDISQLGHGMAAPPAHVAALMLELQAMGCHNISLVTPEHVVPQVLEALLIAVEGGLRLPVLYNTSAYDSLHSLALLDGVVDIYIWKVSAHEYPELNRPPHRAESAAVEAAAGTAGLWRFHARRPTLAHLWN